MRMVRWVVAWGAVCLLSTAGLAGEVEVRVDGRQTHQAYEGFGATTTTLVGAHGDSLGQPLRAKVLEAVYGQVKITMGNLNVGPLESPAGWEKLRNDNDDPHAIDWTGFDLTQIEKMKELVLDPAGPMGFDHWSVAGNISWRWAAPWLGELYKKDRDRALEEAAEQVVAAVTHWKKVTGEPPRLVHLFNEPTSGNREMIGADLFAVRDAIKRVGARLEEAGFGTVRFVVPNEETVRRSIDAAKVILQDEGARRYVAAIGYHCYPYGSAYASVPKILGASGTGKPDERSVAERRELRDLCRRYRVPAWMTEVSHSEVDPRSFDHLRGRAIHIHDEMVYADASAFYGMNAYGDKKSYEAHFAGRLDGNPWLLGSDEIVEAINEDGSMLITGMGYAMGHYARWLTRGAVRLEATSSDSLVQLTAWRDDTRGRLVLVVINNGKEGNTLSVGLAGVAVRGEVEGEQSVERAYWRNLAPTVVGPEGLRLQAPGMSVTTFSMHLTAVDPDRPGPAGGAAE